jgi:F-box protein 25/32
MPFLGRDWRSPGDQWVRTTEGWEKLGLWRLKLFENLNENVIRRLLKLTCCDVNDKLRDRDADVPPVQAYVVIREVSKEQSMRTTIAEALTRLDMEGAVRNHRRSNYVSKLVLFLIQNQLSSLSGMAQKILMNILQQIVVQAVANSRELHAVSQLLDETSLALVSGQYGHVGSSQLWDSHVTTVEKLRGILNEHDFEQHDDDGKLTMSDMPDDVLRHILVHLADHRDLVNTGQTDMRAFVITEESSLWRQLCLFHFSNKQWLSVFRRGEDIESVGWKKLYSRLSKRYGMKEVYADMLHLCRHCNALFWQLGGHPCPVSNVEAKSRPVPPQTFVTLFAA